MARVSRKAVAVVAAFSLAACSDTPVQPGEATAPSLAASRSANDDAVVTGEMIV